MAEAAIMQVKIADLPHVKNLIKAIGVMDAALTAAYNLDPASHATTSRDYGRGFSEALRLVREAIDAEMSALHGLGIERENAGSQSSSPSVTGTVETYGAVTGGNGRSPLPCPTCGLPTWDGIHATGHRACYMSEVPGV